MLLAASVDLTPIIIALLSSGGIAGAIVALLKLRPEASSAAVVQAQGTMEMMQKLNDELEKDRNYWREYAKSQQQLLENALKELAEIRQNVMDHEDRWGNGPAVGEP